MAKTACSWLFLALSSSWKVVQQISTPDEICSDPANAFAAGFIGSRLMNLMNGRIESGAYRAPADGGEVTLRIRLEDCRIGRARTHLCGEIFGVEPMGDATYLTLKVGDILLEIKADRRYRSRSDQKMD